MDRNANHIADRDHFETAALTSRKGKGHLRRAGARRRVEARWVLEHQ